jgi:hypothetical protein
MEENMGEVSRNDARTDQTTASHVEDALRLCARQGIHPALLLMEQQGVPRPVALRVLCSPELFRKQDRSRTARPVR